MSTGDGYKDLMEEDGTYGALFDGGKWYITVPLVCCGDF